MRSVFLSGLVICALSLVALTQEPEELAEFDRIPCGHFMAMMDAVWSRTTESLNQNVYIVYFGGRFRRRAVIRGKAEVIQLSYPNQEDGLNWAKAVPKYLTSYPRYSADYRKTIGDRIVLIDGGFHEEDSVEIWLGVNPPTVLPSLIDPAMIKFRNDEPRPTPDYTRCYEDH